MLSPSLLSALKKPEYFRLVPIIIETEPEIPAAQFAIELREKYGIQKVMQTIQLTNMVATIFPVDALPQLSKMIEIRTVYFDRPMYAFANTPSLTQGWIPTYETVKQIGALELQQKNITGQGVNVAILDTGIDLANPQIRGNALQLNTTPDVVHDINGHGTHCATICAGQYYVQPINHIPMIGIAPQANLICIKVLSTPLGMGSTSDIIKGIELAVNNNVHVISMSLGGEGSNDEDDDPLVRLINGMARSHPHIVVVIAAGNSGPDPQTIGSPGCAKSAITVGSTSIIDNAPAYFSSRGPTIQSKLTKPDISGYGGGRASEKSKPKEYIYSGTSFGSFLDPINDHISDGFTPIAGSSMSTPQIAGVIALWKQLIPKLTSADIKKLFKLHGDKKTNDNGYGLIDARWIYTLLEK